MKRFAILALGTALLFPLMSRLSAQDAANKPGAEAVPGLESEPTIKDWTPAKYPATLAPDITSGSATIRIVVDPHGAISAARVLEASEPAFGEAGVDAVKGWTFSPGQTDGKPVAMCLDVPFEFDRAHPTKKSLLPREDLMPRLAPHTEATAEDMPVNDYPETLRGRGLPGVIAFQCHVNADGTYSNFKVLSASHPDFVLPVLHAVPNWKFEPGKQGDLPIAAELVGEVSFRDANAGPREKILEANGISAADGSVPDPAPAPLRLTDPIFPFDDLVAGEGGSATVEFVVAENGVVRDVRVREASKPEFGEALRAAIACSAFDAAMKHGVGTAVSLVRHVNFPAVAKDAKDDGDSQVRLVSLCRAHAVASARGLDGKLSPLYRVAPVLPDGAEGEKGQAVVEFVIDRDGRARVPRVVSATQPELGWAAATAISQWLFKAPTRKGQPTEVRVQMPFTF